MQAKDLWASAYYAYAPNGVPRGATYVRNCKRAKVIRIRQQKSMFDERARTEALVEFDNGAQDWVRGRDILDFWDSYQHETERRERERQEHKKIVERETAIEDARLERIRGIVTNMLIDRGVPANLIPNLLTFWSSKLQVDLNKLEAALELPPIRLANEDEDGISDREAAIRAIAAKIR